MMTAETQDNLIRVTNRRSADLFHEKAIELFFFTAHSQRTYAGSVILFTTNCVSQPAFFITDK